MSKLVRLAGTMMILCFCVAFVNTIVVRAMEETNEKDTIIIKDPPEIMEVGESESIRFDIAFTQRGVYSFSSSDMAVAVLSGNVIKAVGPGTAAITLKSFNNSQSFEVTVKEIPVSRVEIKQDVCVESGVEINLEPVIYPSNASNKSLVYHSMDESIATVNSQGVLTGGSTGETMITVMAGNNITKNIRVKITDIEVKQISTDKEEYDILVGDSMKVNISMAPQNAKDQSYTAEILDNEIATLEEGDVITTHSSGETFLILTAANGVTKEIPIHVYYIQAEDVAIYDDNMKYLSSGKISSRGAINLTSQVTPNNATYQNAVWFSNDEEVVKIVENGFKIVGTGKVTLTATVGNNISDSITLTVVNPTIAKIKNSILIAVPSIIILSAIGAFVFGKKRLHRITNTRHYIE